MSRRKVKESSLDLFELKLGLMKGRFQRVLRKDFSINEFRQLKEKVSFVVKGNR